jgi:hypothetical protein
MVFDPDVPGVKLAEQARCSNAWVTRTRQKDEFKVVQKFMEDSGIVKSVKLNHAFLNLTLVMSKIALDITLRESPPDDL